MLKRDPEPDHPGQALSATTSAEIKKKVIANAVGRVGRRKGTVVRGAGHRVDLLVAENQREDDK
jgi:hypothetical protein